MGLNSSTKGNRTFISIVNGKFAQRVEKSTPNSVHRVIENKKDGSKKDVWELIYDTVDGVITSIEVDESGSFGDQLKINMSDGGNHFTVTLSMSGREAKNFLCLLKNVDLKKPVILSPYNFESKTDDRQVIGMNTYQGGIGKEFKVKPHFSKETPNGLPQVPENADKDEFKITMKQQEIYLKKWVKKFIGDFFADVQKVSNRESSLPPTDHQAIADRAVAPKKNEKIYTNASTVDPNSDSNNLPF